MTDRARPPTNARVGFIRRATADDAPACASIVNDWIDATPWMLPRVFDRKTIAGFVTSAFAERIIWVAGEPVEAYLSFNPETDQVVALYCRNPGQSIGKMLLDQAKRDRPHLWLTSHAPNTRAQAFYRREGFKETDRIPAEPPEVVDEIRMDWHA